MSDTQALLGKIAALRQRLEQVQGLVKEAGSQAASLVGDDGGALEVLQRRTEAGADHDALLDTVLRPLGSESPVLPTRLTARARRILERGRDLLGRLRALADEIEAGRTAAPSTDSDALVQLYRDTAAMTDSTLRMVQAFPDAPSVQLRLCEGLEAILKVVGERLEVLTEAVGQRRRETERVANLAGLLTALHAEQPVDVAPVLMLAEALLAEAEESAPLQLLHAPADQPASFVACHSLTTAQVMARLVRHDPELRDRSVEAVLAALVHDAGMLRVPAEILGQSTPLNDDQRRTVEAHAVLGAELVRRLLPDAAWLSETVAGHHERLDGTGYPGGLGEVQQGPLTRLLALCDVYAALCCPRPHRPARDPRTALTDTLLLAEQGALDRKAGEYLLLLSFYPVGSTVELADGSVAVVVATHAVRRELNSPARPVVALLTDPQGRPLAVPRYLDLAQCDSHSIVRTLQQRSVFSVQFSVKE